MFASPACFKSLERADAKLAANDWKPVLRMQDLTTFRDGMLGNIFHRFVAQRTNTRLHAERQGWETTFNCKHRQ